jgi:hypothetical protein
LEPGRAGAIGTKDSRLGLGILGRSGYGLGFGDDVSRRKPLRPGLRGERERVGLWSTPPRRQLARAVYSSLDLDRTSPHPTALTFLLGRVRVKTVIGEGTRYKFQKSVQLNCLTRFKIKI